MSSDNTKIKPEIHVLLVAFSAQGHINPLLRLGKSLLTKGLNVTLATTELVYHRVFKSTTTPTSTDNTVPTSYTTNGINVLFFSDGFDITKGNKSPDEYMDLIAEFGPISLTNLIKNNFLNNTSKKLACIINNPFVPWVTNVASEFKIPCACLWIQPCTLYSIYYRFYNKLNQFPTLENPEIDVELPGLPLLKPQDLPSFVLPTNPLKGLSNVLAEMFQDMKKLKWVHWFHHHYLVKIKHKMLELKCGNHKIHALNGLTKNHHLQLYISHLEDSDGFVESEEVERAIGEIVGGERFEVFKKNAVELKLAAREAVADGGSSDRNIQSFVDEIFATVVDDN
ncbi:indole-3-acetate beta-glucosyltransferase [Trifolium repens]|nr:indole-3-acetate beta-glucosyltransferase [Trifolium repens]